MTQEEIFEMARQAGFEGCAELTWEDVVCTEELVAFAKLIEEKAIEEALAQPEQYPQIAINAEIVGYVSPQRTWVGLTDEEINQLWAESHEDGIAMQQGFTTQQHYFAHLILRKAKEK